MSWKFNPFTGKLDYFEETESVDTAERLAETKITIENISALRLLTSVSDTEVELAEPDAYANAKVLGIGLIAASALESVPVLLFGKVEDASFAFPIDTPLFLGASGTVTSVAPVTGVSTTIGYSLGAGAIFIKIEEPIIL